MELWVHLGRLLAEAGLLPPKLLANLEQASAGGLGRAPGMA